MVIVTIIYIYRKVWHMPQYKFSDNYRENIEYYDKLFGIGKNYDIISREQLIAGHSVHFYYIDSFMNTPLLERLFIYLAELKEVKVDDIRTFAAEHLPYTQVMPTSDAAQFVDMIMSGTMGMIVDGLGATGIIIDTRTYPARGVSQSENDRVLRGAHDSFIETVKINSTMIRRRIRDPRLTFERFCIGSASRSDVVLCYIDGRADDDYVKLLRDKLSNIKVDALSLVQESLA